MAPPPAPQTMKERILETADKLFYLQGIRAIGVDTIAAEIGISKRTLYNHFPSKDALIAAYLERRFVQPRPSDKPPAEQILATFNSLERRFAAKDFRGCPFVNAVAELGPADRAVKKIAIAFKESRRVWFRDRLQRARRCERGGARNAARAAGRRLDRPGPRPRRPRNGARREGSGDGVVAECRGGGGRSAAVKPGKRAARHP